LAAVARKVYSSEENYLLTAHSGAFGWALQIAEIAKSWPDYTPAVGAKAQADVVTRALQCAMRIDRNNGDEIVIDPEEATIAR
jgi:hypothetical protein